MSRANNKLLLNMKDNPYGDRRLDMICLLSITLYIICLLNTFNKELYLTKLVHIL